MRFLHFFCSIHILDCFFQLLLRFYFSNLIHLISSSCFFHISFSCVHVLYVFEMVKFQTRFPFFRKFDCRVDECVCACLVCAFGLVCSRFGVCMYVLVFQPPLPTSTSPPPGRRCGSVDSEHSDMQNQKVAVSIPDHSDTQPRDIEASHASVTGREA